MRELNVIDAASLTRTARYNWDEPPKEKVRRGVVRSAFRGDNAMLVMNWSQPGMEVRPHLHLFDRVAHVVKGRMRFTVEDKIIAVGQGDLLRFPAGAMHCDEIVGEDTVLNLDLLSPIRDDDRHLTEYQQSDFGC